MGLRPAGDLQCWRFPEGIRLDNLLVAAPHPRSPLLTDVFKRTGLMERTGRGINRTFTEQVRVGWPAPDYGHSTGGQFAAYGCTPTAVAEHPDLADVTSPATALFIDAFTEANGLATGHYPGAQRAERFVGAAQGAQRAWQMAVDTARHSGISRSALHERVLLPPQRHTDWTSTRPGRHRAPARGPRHSLDRPAQMRSHPQH